ncbi:hypothetical protein [Arcobacter sp. L]|uniref:hypothetical protein n=1 Tax=Arcobacter sp. L TaxID=944547 RepID=UPI0002296505|nr:hypothetical protein [Arcobacter sp. L]BAK73762.1 hypothetical protein ABLL_1887 [Arcobacter sp. L]
MTIKVTAKQGDRLDKIVQEKLGTLDNFKEVLELNSSLKNKLYLDENDVVILPIIEKKIKVEDELW